MPSQLSNISYGELNSLEEKLRAFIVELNSGLSTGCRVFSPYHNKALIWMESWLSHRPKEMYVNSAIDITKRLLQSSNSLRPVSKRKNTSSVRCKIQCLIHAVYVAKDMLSHGMENSSHEAIENNLSNNQSHGYSKTLCDDELAEILASALDEKTDGCGGFEL